VIGRVYRGGNVGGLLRYLYGPGRHNEHESPHLVAAWDLESAQELATLEPEVLSGDGAHAVRDYRPMTGSSSNGAESCAKRDVPSPPAVRDRQSGPESPSAAG
jgi:hypothetical protein